MILESKLLKFKMLEVTSLYRYYECRDWDKSRYIVFSVSGLPVGVYLAIWGPIEWTEDDYNVMRPYLAKAGNQILKALHIEAAFFQQDLTEDNFNFYDSQERNHQTHVWTTGHYITLGVGIFLVTSLLIATSMEILKYYKEKAIQNLGIQNHQDDEGERRRPTWIQKYFNAFRLFENSKKLLFARSRDGDKNLELLNGLRVISMGWVILGHTYFYSLQGALANPLVPLEFFKMFSFNLVSSGPYAVDIFFWLSGFLGVYLLLCSMSKKRGRMQPFYLVYLHRFLRLMPMYIATMLFYWFLMGSVGTGPINFMYYEKNTKYCKDVWWIHFTFLNNFVELDKNINYCMGWTWYLPNDFQFFLLIPLFVYLLFHKRVLGMIFIGVFQGVWFIITIIVAYAYNLRPSYFEATNDYWDWYYYRPYIRIPPFTIGVFTALMLYSFNFEKADESRLKRWMDKVHESRALRMLLYFIGSVLFFGMIFIFYPINNHPENFGDFFNVMFLTFSRAILITGMSMILLPAMMGHCWAVRSFLSLDVFTPLARLTFGAYMVHPIFMWFDAFNSVKSQYVTINFGIVKFICWIVVSFLTSLGFTLLVETPFMILEKTFLMGGGKKKKKLDKMGSQVSSNYFFIVFVKFGNSITAKFWYHIKSDWFLVDV